MVAHLCGLGLFSEVIQPLFGPAMGNKTRRHQVKTKPECGDHLGSPKISITTQQGIAVQMRALFFLQVWVPVYAGGAFGKIMCYSVAGRLLPGSDDTFGFFIPSRCRVSLTLLGVGRVARVSKRLRERHVL